MCDASHLLHTPSRNPAGISHMTMADAPEEESPSRFLELEVEEGGWEAPVCFLYFLNFNLITFSSSSAALSATFHSNPSMISMCFGVNAVPLEGLKAGTSLRLTDAVLDAHLMISCAILKSEKSMGSPARSYVFRVSS